jgi:cytochrome c oxidase subunit II
LFSGRGYNTNSPESARIVTPLPLAAATVPFGAPFLLGPAPTLQGRQIYHLGEIFVAAGIGVAVIVYGLIFWSILRYRKRSEALPPQFHQNVPLEITYTVIPLLIVACLFVATYAVETFVDRVAPSGDPVTIHVIGYQWSWQFLYEGTGVQVSGTPDHPPVAVVPVGTPLRFILTSVDVDHSFWIPAFLFKRDALPGWTNRFDLTVERPGTYLGECAEYCGFDHTRMRFTITAVEPAAFAQWLRRERVVP